MEMKFNLTKEQDEIINSDYPIKRILACAGSGKTSVLTENIIKILSDNLCKPSEILALTFTNNAAENMREKIREKLNYNNDIDSIDIYTFNSFGNKIIIENSFYLGYGKNFQLINDVQAWQIIYEIFKDYSFNSLKAGKNIGEFVNHLLEYIWNLKNNLITLQEIKYYINNYEKYLCNFKSKSLLKEEEEKIPIIKELSDIYEYYEKIKRENNYIDYADQVFLPYFLFKENEVLRKKYILKYKYIFVDEFQDTNNAQAYLLSMIYSKKFNKLMIVGDDDQGIYGFRGACIENIQDFNYFTENVSNEIKTFFLTTNFRSGKNIINFTNFILSDNKRREEKIIKPENNEKKSAVVFLKTDYLEEEADKISEIILKLNFAGYRYKDIAILCRKKRFNNIIKSFKKFNIKYELVGSKSYFYEPEIIFLVSWLKVINNIYDDESIIYLLKSGKYKISDRDIYFLRKLNSEFENYNKNELENINLNNFSKNAIINSLRNIEISEYFSEETKQRFKSFLNELNYYLENYKLLPLNAVINLIFHYSGLYDELNSRFGSIAKKKIRNVENLIKLAYEFEENNFNVDFDSFIIYLKEIAKTDYEDPDLQVISNENSVKIMSIHASKGLEFKVVFLPMLWEQNFKPRKSQASNFELPSLLRKDGKIYKDKYLYTSVKKYQDELKNILLEEERRIFYVGCSRAREILILSYPQYENQSDILNNNLNQKNLLPFIKDILLKEKNIILFEGKTKDYLQENFNIKEGFYINNLDKLKVIFDETYNYNNLRNNNKSYKSKKNNVANLLNESVFKNIERSLAANMNDIKKVKSIDLLSSLDNEIFINKFLDGVNFNLTDSKNTLKEKLQNNNDNYSLTEILDFYKCPILYKYKYEINLPEPESIDEVIGTKVHIFLQYITSFCFKLLKENKLDKYKNLKLNYQNLIEKKINNNEEEISKEIDETLDFKDLNLLKYIKNFFNSDLLSLDSCENVLTEQLFYWKINSFYLTCKIDRIDFLNNKTIRIYDYKTSTNKNDDNYLFQIKTYICGISDLYNISVDNIEGIIFYLGDGSKNIVKITNKEKENTINNILNIIENIKNADFNNINFQKCKNFCNFKDFCFSK